MKRLILLVLMLCAVKGFGTILDSEVPRDKSGREGAMVCDENGRIMDVNIHGAAETQDISEAELEEGNLYSVQYYNPVLTTVQNIVIVSTPSTGHTCTHTHVKLTCTTGSDGYLRVYENPTITSTGTTLSVINRNRYSSNTSEIGFGYAPTVTSSGTLIVERFVPGGTQTHGVGFSLGGLDLILACAYQYLFILHNQSAGTDDYQIKIYFYSANE